MIEALTFPRMYIIRSIDERRCIESGFFRADSASCHSCAIDKPCHWLSCHEKFSDLAKKPLFTIHASLLYCVDLIAAGVVARNHDEQSCTCEDCDWLREARLIIAAYNNSKEQQFTFGQIRSNSMSVFQ